MVLLGAAEGLARSIGSAAVIHSSLAVCHQNCDRKARAELSDRAFETAYQKGLSFDFESAIAYALDEHPPSTANAPSRGFT